MCINEIGLQNSLLVPGIWGFLTKALKLIEGAVKVPLLSGVGNT